MKITNVLKALLIVFLILSTASISPVFAEGIKVGVLLPLTGKLAEFGALEWDSFQMAVGEINDAGGIDGKKIQLIIKDTTGVPETGKIVAERLILEKEVCAVCGGISSSVAWEVARIAKKSKVPFLVSTASADKITEKGGAYVFRLSAPVSEFHVPLISFLTKVARIKTVAVIYENTLYGHTESKQFIRRCQESKFQVLVKEVYEKGETEFENLLLKINRMRPDLFYVISSSTGTDSSLIIKQARELRLDTKLLVGGGAGFALQKFQENTGDASEYVFAVCLWSPSVQYPGASDYFNRYVAKYNEPTEYHGAQAYSAMYVIADALKRAKSHTPHDVRDALSETDIMTVFGPVKFVSYGKKKNQNKIPTFLGQWINGKFEAVWPKELSNIEYVYPAPAWENTIKLFDDADLIAE